MMNILNFALLFDTYIAFMRFFINVKLIKS